VAGNSQKLSSSKSTIDLISLYQRLVDELLIQLDSLSTQLFVAKIERDEARLLFNTVTVTNITGKIVQKKCKSCLKIYSGTVRTKCCIKCINEAKVINMAKAREVKARLRQMK